MSSAASASSLFNGGVLQFQDLEAFDIDDVLLPEVLTLPTLKALFARSQRLPSR